MAFVGIRGFTNNILLLIKKILLVVELGLGRPCGLLGRGWSLPAWMAFVGIRGFTHNILLLIKKILLVVSGLGRPWAVSFDVGSLLWVAFVHSVGLLKTSCC